MKTIIGKKVGMTQIFDEQGKVIPVTVIEAGPEVVTQIKTVETDGYNAVQVAFEDQKAHRVNKPMTGHFEKAGVAPKKHVAEFRVEEGETYEVGQVIEGKVVQIKEYGAFVELEPGLDGLVHISEVAHKRVENINNELQVGQIVNVKILEIDKDRKRISLSIRQVLEEEAFEEIPAEVEFELVASDEAPVEEVAAEEAPEA